MDFYSTCKLNIKHDNVMEPNGAFDWTIFYYCYNNWIVICPCGCLQVATVASKLTQIRLRAKSDLGIRLKICPSLLQINYLHISFIYGTETNAALTITTPRGRYTVREPGGVGGTAYVRAEMRALHQLHNSMDRTTPAVPGQALYNKKPSTIPMVSGQLTIVSQLT